MTAEYKVHGDVAVITMNNPPVNGLGYATRVALAQGIDQANADDGDRDDHLDQRDAGLPPNRHSRSPHRHGSGPHP